MQVHWLVFVPKGFRQRRAARRATRAFLAGRVEPLTPALAHELAASGCWDRAVVYGLLALGDALYARRADALLVHGIEAARVAVKCAL